jgi:hypothetical protein
MDNTRNYSNLPYDEWPGHIQIAFESYRRMPVPLISRLHNEPGMTRPARTYRLWSTQYDWTGQINRLNRAEAEAARRKEDERRKNVLENAHNGMANGLSSIGLAMSGICPTCKGTGATKASRKPGETDTRICALCKGDGMYDPLRAPTKSLAILYDRLDKAWGYTMSGETDEGSSAITPAEQRRLATEMLHKAGISTGLEESE